ncbi:prohibitin family protein [Opitutus sp. ER46]|uniref:prohibitin family protein n=1 Tax=Opitutus sp. ER46 TaxID=2161864 RepID=UPI001304A5F5|nr:prohibitin family protein [Opitutus sp. ER46]
MKPRTIVGLIGGAVLIFILILAATSASYVVEPGNRGVQVTLGKVSSEFKPEGFGFKMPFITTVVPQAIRQQTAKMRADCYSSDLQQVKIDVRLLYRVPQASVVTIYRDYAGDPFDTLIRPRVAEALNEVTASRTAELIVKKREEVKSMALQSARRKVGDLLVIEDVVLENIDLTNALEAAIEAKMVQEQEAARSRFAQQQAQIEANTAVIKARGEAESIVLRGKALRENPSVLELQVIEHWDGITPLVVGPGATGANMMLPLGDFTTGAKPVQKEEKP